MFLLDFLFSQINNKFIKFLRKLDDYFDSSFDDYSDNNYNSYSDLNSSSDYINSYSIDSYENHLESDINENSNDTEKKKLF